MTVLDYIVLGWLVISAILLFGVVRKNRVQKAENEKLKERLEAKEMTIQDLEALNVASEEMTEELSVTEAVMAGIDAGLSREEVSQNLGIPVNRIELIIKFDKIRKAQTHVS
ncbi:MAG: sigma-70 family RNA polymerase sigma factor [Sulfurimonas sp.]